MAYMRKNVNLFLLFVILIVVVSLAGLTSYYQSTYKNLSTSYDTKLAEVEKLLADLNKERTALNQTTLELSIKEERETQLSGQYTTVKTDLQATEQELDATKTVLSSTKDELASTTASLVDAEAKVSQLIATVANLQSDINEWKNKYNQCESEKAACTCPT